MMVVNGYDEDGDTVTQISRQLASSWIVCVDASLQDSAAVKRALF